MKSKIISTILLSATLSFAFSSHAAEPYPNKPIRLVVPFGAGGSTDVVARVLGRKMSEELGQAVIVDNKAGANTIIGADAVAKSPPDGYTLLVSIDNTWSMNQFLYDKLPYDPVNDFQAVAKVAIIPILLISSEKGPHNFAELLSRARKDPANMSYGYGAITSQLSGEILKTVLNAPMQGIAYKGSAGVLQGLLSNDVDFGIDTIAAERAHIAAGKFKLIANMGKIPVPGFPDVPSVASETGDHSIDAAFWLGITAPRKTPAAVIDRLNKAIVAASHSPEYHEAMNAAGLIPDYLPAQAFEKFMAAETTKWGKIITAAGIKIQ